MPIFLAASGFTVTPAGGGILFAANSNVPPAVRDFAWRVIETRCEFQRHEVDQRSFWAYDARTRNVGSAVVYSIRILSELTWKKTEPPATFEVVVANRRWPSSAARVSPRRSSAAIPNLRARV